MSFEKWFRLLTMATTLPARRKQIFAMSSLCEPRRKFSRLKKMAPQVGLESAKELIFNNIQSTDGTQNTSKTVVVQVN
jgi:hypothetical protein